MTREYQCDALGYCPFGESNSGYFCRDMCGLGVDDNVEENEE